MPAQLEHYIVVMQLPIVSLLILFTLQARKAFAEKNFALIAIGWLANLVYLLFGHAARHPDDQVFGMLSSLLPATEIARIANVMGLYFFFGAAQRFLLVHRPKLALARVSQTWLAVAFLPVLLLEIGRPHKPSLANTLSHVPATVMASGALFAIAIVFDDTLRSRETIRRSKSRLLLVGGASVYALIQPLALAPGEWSEAIGFTAGFGCKATMLVGLVGGFVMFAETAARTDAVRRRMGELARTIGRITHELNTPIRLLDNQITTLIRVAPSHGEFANQLVAVENTILRIDSVIDATLTLLPKPDSLLDVGLIATNPEVALPERTLENVNVNTLLQLAIMAVKETRGERVYIRTSYAGHCCINCVPFEIVRIFINLLRNAYDAVAPTAPGHLLITTRSVDGNQVQISVVDDGHGIPPALMVTLYEDGVTTRHGPGRGYGMGVVKQLTEDNGGTVSIESPAPKHALRPGTSVTILFPRAKCLSKEERFGTRSIVTEARNRRRR